MRVSCVTVLRAEFMAEMARHRMSPSGMNWDWLIGDMLIGDTSPAGQEGKVQRIKLRVAEVALHWLHKDIWTEETLQIKSGKSGFCGEQVYAHRLNETFHMHLHLIQKNLNTILEHHEKKRRIYRIWSVCVQLKSLWCPVTTEILHDQVCNEYIEEKTGEITSESWLLMMKCTACPVWLNKCFALNNKSPITKQWLNEHNE